MTFRLYALDRPLFPLLFYSFLCLKCRSPCLSITNSFSIFSHFHPLYPPQWSSLTRVCMCAKHIWTNRYSFPADITNRDTSHLLKRLMSVISHNLIIGFSMCVHACGCVRARVFLDISSVWSFSPTMLLFFPTPTSHCLSLSDPLPSLAQSSSLTFLFSPISVHEDVVRSPRLCVCLRIQGRQRIRNTGKFLYHPLRCCHLTCLQSITKWLRF